ncbi:MAG: hypothetical protein OK449_03875 [Thaumarchaeota archaeon]|nr:hypothetical protein [Nitrososphaerota archaeon]
MLKYEVRQLHLEDTGRYYLPIPKLNASQFRFVRDDLRGRGYTVVLGERLTARMGDVRLILSQAGLAWSTTELLDAVVPSLIHVLGFPKGPCETNPYFAARKTRGGFEIQLFPRLEGLGCWSSLRRQNESGLSPDEALIVKDLVTGSNDEVECITDYPTDGCSPMQVGRHQYYRSRVPAEEFASNLRTISKRPPRSCYLPRSSLLTVKRRSITLDSMLSEDLGEWCYLELPPKTSNPGD